VTACAAILALLVAAPPSGDNPAPAPASPTPLLRLASIPIERAPPVAARTQSAEAAPACSGDVCQPRVAVPGFEPQISMRGKRTELVLALLDRARIEPLATVVWTLAATGLRVDYTPAAFDSGAVSYGHGGWGHLQILLRWRLDAENGPVWPERRK
jgi:hypothetical protein